MTCHHTKQEKEAGFCTTYDGPVKEWPSTPDPEEYEITEIQRCGKHLVLNVKYPSCENCEYEGNKILVFLNVTEVEVLKWRKIDPHFRNVKPTSSKEAPSPAARFPASDQGWSDAIEYAYTKK